MKEFAAATGIAVNTAHTHRNAGMKKLGVKNNAVYRVMTDAGFSREKTGLILQGRGQRKVLDPASLKKMHESNPELVQRWLAKQREHAMFFDVTK